jgi:3-methyladenine DNA glycosylase/8-oxoguanine DNA glycosylase
MMTQPGLDTMGAAGPHAAEPRTIMLDIAGRYDLVTTLRPLARGAGDATMRITEGGVDLAVRRRAGPVTLRLRQAPGQDGDARVSAHAWGPGSVDLASWLPGFLGVDGDRRSTGELRDAPDRIVAELARRMPGIRIPATGAVLDALIPAILEQKVTGDEARRAWRGLVRTFGEPAPGAAAAPRAPTGTAAAATEASATAPNLRLSPHPDVLARTPYYRLHPLGVERRRAELIRHVATRSRWADALVDVPPTEAQARLRTIAGIGPWTAAEVAVRALGDDDAVSVGDFHLPHIVAWALAREPRADDTRMLELLDPYAGRRALVVRLLEESGLHAPRYGPRLSPRRIEGY